jgi:hypothetical protein
MSTAELLLYMVFRRLKYNSEVPAVSEVCRRFHLIARKVLERPRRTLPVEPIKIVRQLRRMLNRGDRDRLREYLSNIKLLKDGNFARRICS